MQRLLVLFVLLTILVPSVQADSVPPTLGQGIVDTPSVGQSTEKGPSTVDLANLPVPDELASTGFAMEFNTRKRDLGAEWIRSLDDAQRARIGQLLEDSHPAALDGAVAEMAQAKPAANELGRDVETIDALLAEVNGWQSAVAAGLAEILTPEQYNLYQDSLLPAPEPLTANTPASQNDCYIAYVYLYYYGNVYAYYFYIYAYYTSATTSDPYAGLTYNLAYNTYLYSYYGWIYNYYAYLYYYNSTYSGYAYYVTRHAEGFAYYGSKLAYSLYTWTQNNGYSYYASSYGSSAYTYIKAADDYSKKCYGSSSSGPLPNEGQYHVYLPYVARRSQSPAQPADPRSAGDDEGVPLPPEMTLDLSSLPVPPELADTGFAMPSDAQKAQAGAEWIQSLSPDQRQRIQALLGADAHLAAFEQMAATLAHAAQSVGEMDLDRETLDAALAEMNRWENAVSDGLAGILTPEQYELYQESRLPAPDTWMNTAPESQNDCYYGYYYLYYYGNMYAYYYYLYTYYAYAYNSDPYLYDSYLYGYQTYVTSYYGYIYNYYAYAYYYNSTYAYYAYYYTRHAQGLSYWGYQYAAMAHSWVNSTYSYYGYLFGYYSYYYINLADGYTEDCYSSKPSTQKILSVPSVLQTQTQWCWAATSEGILKYYGTTLSQCTIANYNWNRTDCCTSPSSSSCNQPNNMFGSRPSLQDILSHWSVSSTSQYSAVAYSSVQTEINASRPVIARWGWDSGGGHFLTVRGYDSSNSNVYYINPGDGYHTSTYSWFNKGDSHTWTHSLTNVKK